MRSRRNLPPNRGRRSLQRFLRAIAGNNDHINATILQVNEKHNALDDNVQTLTETTNDRIADLEQRVYDLENP